MIEAQDVVAAATHRHHTLNTPNDTCIRLLTGLGLDGDARPVDVIRIELAAPPHGGLEPV